MKLLLSAVLLITSLYAKNSNFSVIIKKPFNESLLDITEDYDRTITAVGFSQNYRTYKKNNRTYTNAFDYLSDVSNSNGIQSYIVTIDKYATILLSKSENLPEFNKAVSIIKTAQSGYFIGGYTLDGSLIILKLDSNTNIIFTKIFGTKNYDKMNKLIPLSDGGVLAVGSSVTSRDQNDEIFKTGLGKNDIFLSRFSKNGTQLWSKKYGTNHDDRGIDATQARDGSIIVLAQTAYDKNKNVLLIRITENGDKIWLKEYKSDNQITPHRILRLKDDNFLVSLTQADSGQKEQIRLIKFDLHKNILIDKIIHTSYSSTINDIKEFSNGNFIAVGYVKDTYNTDALAMIIDSNLNMLNQEHYGDENYDSFNALTILHNSQVAVAGLTTAKNSQESNMWIVKLNKDASIAHITTKSTKLYSQLRKLFKKEIDSKQITIQKDLSIDFVSKSLLFNAGQFKLSRSQKNFLDKFCMKLIPFLKKYKNSIKTLEVNGYTSSEWANLSDTYLKNSKLSMKRSFSTLSYIYNSQNKIEKKWLAKILKGSGYSYSKKLMFNQVEDKKHSRRVSIKILTLPSKFTLHHRI